MSQNVMPYVYSDRPRLEQVLPGVYRVDLPMPQAIGPTNSYIFKADGIHDAGRSLIVDVGCNCPLTGEAFDAALAQLGISWDAVDVFITHFHWDHWAGLDEVWHPGMTVYAGVESIAEGRMPVMKSREIGEIERKTSERFQVGDVYDEAYWVPMTLVGTKDVPLTVAHEGDVISVGGYTLTVLETPGHDLRHIALYDEQAKLLVAGDQMLYNQYPSIMMESDTDQLGIMLETIKRMEALDASLVLCGHGQEGHELRERCEKTIDHYHRQVASFKELCTPDNTDPGTLAYLSTKRPRRTPWEKRPIFGRRALISQTMAYLKFLVTRGELPDIYKIVPLR